MVLSEPIVVRASRAVVLLSSTPQTHPKPVRAGIMSSFALRNASRAVPALARGYATPASLFSVQDASGVKVASSNEGSSTGAISVVVNAGSRYESAPGLAHVLKNSVFKVRSASASCPHLPFGLQDATHDWPLRDAPSMNWRTGMTGGRLKEHPGGVHVLTTCQLCPGYQQEECDSLGAGNGGARRSPLIVPLARAPRSHCRVCQG